MKVVAPESHVLEELLVELLALGCYRAGQLEDALVRTTDQDGCAPEDFYSSTNHRTQVRLTGQWANVQDQRMDAAIVLDSAGVARCRKLRDLHAGDRVV